MGLLMDDMEGFGRGPAFSSLSALYHFFFKSFVGWVKVKLKLPHFHVSDTHAPVATAARAAVHCVSVFKVVHS